MTAVRAAALAGCVALVAISAARAGPPPQVALLSPFTPPRPEPPLRVVTPGSETRFFGHLDSTQTVTVAVDPTGRPVQIVDVDRIVVARKGDYTFAVPAPVEDVRAAEGSGSEPGLRSNAVIWQGFSPGRRLLAAAITLRVDRAASALPLRIEIDGARLRIVNTTSADVQVTEAPASADEVARSLDASRAALAAQTPAPTTIVKALGPTRDVRIRSFVPIQVEGTVGYGGGRRRVISGTVGGAPLVLAVHGPVRSLTLSASVPEPASLLRPPRGRRWLDLARSGQLRNGRAVTRLAEERLLTAALAGQFHEFLANPDTSGVTKTAYRYQLATTPRPPAQESAGGTPWLALSIAVAAVVAALGAVVLWAHS